jgi:hypothetical protein
LFTEHKDALGAGYALALAGYAFTHTDTAQAETCFDQAEALLRRFGPTKTLAQLLCLRGIALGHLGQSEAATRMFEESLGVARTIGYRGWAETVELNLAEIAHANGRTEEAIIRARQASASCRASGNVSTLAVLLHNLAGYLLTRNDWLAARDAGAEALRLHLVMGASTGVTLALQHLALAAALADDMLLAARLAGYCDRYYERERRTREHNERGSAETLASRLASCIPHEERERLRAEGAGWTENQAAAALLEGRKEA